MKNATTLYQHLSQKQRTGQRLMVGFDGLTVDDTLKYYIDGIKVGGIILFSRNLDSPDQIQDLCGQAQEYTQQCGQPPLFIGIDQEGGQVARLKPPFTQFKGNPHITSTEEAVHFAQVTARELNQIGVNMNMAPVLDVLPEKGESVMEKRAFGSDPHHVARMGAAMIEQFQKNGILAVAKHFPGIGNTVLDSHIDRPDLDISLKKLTDRDMMPYHTAIDKNVAGIMLSHIRYHCLDPHWPASLSPVLVNDMLRQKMNYEGLVLTDDLDMGAITKYYNLADIIQQCLKATVDIILICHPGPKIEAALKHILDFEDKDTQLGQKGALSVQRILQYKKTYLEQS